MRQDVAADQEHEERGSEDYPADVRIRLSPRGLEGLLASPENSRGLVVFAHGSGSGRFSPRNTWVARQLQRAGFATLLFDLLTEDESRERRNVFDIPLLAERLREATTLVCERPDMASLPIGYFGASTGAAAALTAAALDPGRIAAVVSRGGRPDLAETVLASVRSPTLLIVGGRDPEVLELNRAALELLRCEKSLVVASGATHLFEEPGTLELVAQHAQSWFTRHLAAREP
jgi:putative phosphoribosyl transferase